jgi:hypothetical protein
MKDLIAQLEAQIEQTKDKNPFGDLPPHPDPQLIISKLITKNNNIVNDLYLERAKHHQLRDYIDSKGLYEDFIAWKVGRRMEGKDD